MVTMGIFFTKTMLWGLLNNERQKIMEIVYGK